MADGGNEVGMSGRLGTLLQAGLALKGNQLRHAFGDYVSDRVTQGQHLATTYAVAAGLYAAAGIFLIAAALVGLAALFRYVEIYYGLFPAFGVVGGLLLMVALICFTLARSRVKPAQPVAALSKRLDEAVHTSPVYPKAAELKQRKARAAARAALPPPRIGMAGKTGLTTAALLMGWAMARRYNLGAQAKRLRRRRADRPRR